MLNQRGQRNADGLADEPGTSWRLCAQDEALIVLLDSDFFDAIEITHDIAPFRIVAGGGEALIEFLAQDKGEE